MRTGTYKNADAVTLILRDIFTQNCYDDVLQEIMQLRYDFKTILFDQKLEDITDYGGAARLFIGPSFRRGGG